MIRGFLRFIGLLLLAGGFVFLVYDGARSIADQTVQLTRFDEFWNDIHQASQASFQSWVEGFSPALWSHGFKVALAQPSWAILGLAGLLLMLAARPPKRLIGYARD
ncbi:MAG TPA: hypothetical protein VNZ94_10845 [Xanthobacteraceae bacterium]|nr:hypothetical protein [Xanthobacteraceae bacterium]